MPQSLRELDASFYKIVDERTMRQVDDIREADGVLFLCPKCYAHNGGPVGTHRVPCWQPHVPQTWNPKPGRWKFEGSGLDDLTLVAGSSSVLLTDYCRRPGCPNDHREGGGCADPRCAGWHGFVRAGRAVN